MTRRAFLPLAVMLAAGAAACSPHVAPMAQPAGPGAMDTVSIARAPVVVPQAGDSAKTFREYRGAFSSGFEVSWFEPCDAAPGDSRWWVTLSEEARADRDSLLKRLPVRPTQGLAVRWLATVSAKMPAGAGHMGRGSRYMLVSRILSLRALDGDGGGACGVPVQSG